MIKPDSPKHILKIQIKSFEQIVLLDKSTFSIGRHPSNSIIVCDPVLSRHHATILRIKYKSEENYKDVFWIIDGDLKGNRSKNGLFVNQKRCLSHELSHGDLIFLGANHIRVSYEILDDSDNEGVSSFLRGIAAQYQPNINEIQSYKITNQLCSKEHSDNLTEEFLLRLSYAPELLPHPIIEINTQGEITYLNSIALEQFKQVQNLAYQHPLLAGLLEEISEKKGKMLIREVEIQDDLFTEYAHYLSVSNTVRVYVFDSKKRKKIEQLLRDSENRYRSIINQISEGIIIVDIETKNIVEANAAYCNLIGFSSEEIVNLNIKEIVAIEQEIFSKELEQLIRQRINLTTESVHRHKNGSLINVDVNISIIDYDLREFLCFAVRDITQEKKQEELIRYQSFHDSLTGLANRNLFNEHLAIALANAKRYVKILGVLFLDIDRFKNINDTLGHAIGDRLIQEVAKRLGNCLRSSDALSRWGGDEFTVLLLQIETAEDAGKIAERIIKSMHKPFIISKYQLRVTISIGIAVYPTDGDNVETLLKHADAALYRNKEHGGNHYEFYSQYMSTDTEEILKLENLLHHALEREQLFLNYQPQINLKTGKIVGMEALLRWQHPKLGIISPEKFIPLAEKTGQIVPIGEWVFKTACTQTKIWHEKGLKNLRIAINVSARQLKQSDLLSMVATLLEETQLEPHFLELEITETAIMENAELGCRIIQGLRDMGVHISMDDFGTGYSSLGYLKKFPFNKIKIDQSFVKEMNNNSQDIAIVSAIIALCCGFNLGVIAEGVETQAQLDLLKNLQCEEIQGYLISRPLSQEDATAYLLNYIGNKE